ncbi:mitochondrial 54S ribosomal protein YmL35 [Coemansia sp. RSA 1813]|nr:mitochondrial 54S ribosomal protein YmL35 [Coemansia sp. RSA 1646]KAJ1767479.1 mitochondrial 54S ribosomal protein YmL35 [Coemansia sp. RSA 1843]KAJ2087178.1 mitochondrial 54S ribosomal protein YmL35 [Coemansia sp. RSA 986]KAJ2211981.1 mitochondrial 54S ribosomal protein YmL35 [Coemansia sp. RSA 487]KAJ2565972.1 mitochondrial 54S ribosomal protein YmL35 [Coemansia sp. RSA 1813]
MNAATRAFALANFGRRVAARPLGFLSHTQAAMRWQSTYTKPATGVNPAYDEALKVIEAYKTKRLAEAEIAAKELKEAQESGADADKISALKKTWFGIAADAEINDSEVLWNARQGNYDLNRPVYEYLKENEWLGRPLEILMQRLLQMFVLPDMLDPRDVGTPESQLNVSMPGSSVLEPGSIIDPAEALQQPEIELVTFHDDTRHHTLLMVDLDEPFEEQQSFREQLHWAVADVPFSKMQSKAVTDDKANVLLPYIPPHPAKGTPTHRYVLAVFEQGKGGREQLGTVDISRNTVVRDFVSQHSLRLVGISFFRASWNEAVDGVYRNVLKTEPPNYGPMPAERKDIGPDGRKINMYENY